MSVAQDAVTGDTPVRRVRSTACRAGVERAPGKTFGGRVTLCVEMDRGDPQPGSRRRDVLDDVRQRGTG